MLFKKKIKLSTYSLVLSLFTLVAFHVPFFTRMARHLEGGFNSVMLVGMAVLVMLGLNFLLYYLLSWLGRFVGKCLIALTFIADAVMLFGVVSYDVLVTDEIMGCVFNTKYSEVSVAYILLFGVLPSIYVLARKVEYGSW